MSTTYTYAPIAVFAFDRPQHLRRCLEHLNKNELAEHSNLYIFIDGLKEANNTQSEINVIDVAEHFPWKGRGKVIIRRNKNYGLAANITSGVTEIINTHGKIIVVEDDLETSPGFLTYMNQALELYENEEKVMHISGYMFPIHLQTTSETFFYQVTSCWGWGTWADSWKNYNPDAGELLAQLSQNKMLKWFDLENSGIFLPQLIANEQGKMKTWAIKWQASVNLRGGLCLHPYKSLVRNIGFDASGEHCPEDKTYTEQHLAKKVHPSPIPIKLDKDIRRVMITYYRKQKPTLQQRARARLSRIFSIITP